MPCPGCQKPMKERFARGRTLGSVLPVWSCTFCWGLFLKRGGQEELGLADRMDRCRVAPQPGERRCPSCERRMEVLQTPRRLAQLSRVELDRCPACQAIFFDGDELEQVLGRRTPVSNDLHDEDLLKDPPQVGPEPKQSYLDPRSLEGIVHVLERLFEKPEDP